MFSPGLNIFQILTHALSQALSLRRFYIEYRISWDMQKKCFSIVLEILAFLKIYRVSQKNAL